MKALKKISFKSFLVKFEKQVKELPAGHHADDLRKIAADGGYKIDDLHNIIDDYRPDWKA